MDKVIVIVSALVLIGLIAWWFFGPKNQAIVESEQKGTDQSATITVDGGYSPAVLSLKAGVPAHITFMRKDPSGCLEEIIMPDFGIAEKLPMNEPFTVLINPSKVGDYTYTCGMRMFSGKIRVI